MAQYQNAANNFQISATNIAIGKTAGSSYTSETGNIVIGNTGTVADASVIRIGTSQTDTYLVGTVHAPTVAANIIALPNATSTVGQITLNSNRFFHNRGTSTVPGRCIWAGTNAGNLTLTGGNMTGVGMQAGLGATSSINCTMIGKNAGTAISSSIQHTLAGNGAGASLTAGGNQNIGIGDSALANLVSGSFNFCFGYSAGSGLTTSDSSNIMIGNNGTAGDGHAIRIGVSGSGNAQQNKCFIAGTTATVTGTAVLVSTSDQLGVAASSLRFKTNIKDMALTSSPVMKLRPVTFIYKDDATNDRQFGLIAEEVAPIFPELVEYDGGGNLFTVHYHKIAALLLNEIIQLHKDIQELENG